MQPQTPLLGPCGGAACYTAEMLRTVRTRTGEIFPESFFCYAEDTDLAARAALLGFDCVQLDGPGVLHHGSLSSGGGDSEFVMRHGLGNSLRVMHRTLPLRLLLANFGWMLLAQLGILAKYVRRGRFRLLLSVFGDFFRAWDEDARMRARLRRAGLLQACALRDRIARGIYPPSYLKREFTRLFARDRASSEPIAR
jgi:GT2 family glycosyltransferase